MKSHSLTRNLGEAVTMFVMLAAFSSLMISSVSAHTDPIPTIIVVPNHATYEVTGEFIQGGSRLIHARAPFGSGGSCPLQATINSFWRTGTTIILRKEFQLPQGASNLRVLLSIDNDAQVFINGTNISNGRVIHENCPIVDEFELQVHDDNLVEGTNVLEVRATDRGDESYVDLRVLIDLP